MAKILPISPDQVDDVDLMIGYHYSNHQRVANRNTFLDWKRLSTLCSLTHEQLNNKVLTGELSAEEIKIVEQYFVDTFASIGEPTLFKFFTNPISIKSEDEILAIPGVDLAFTPNQIYHFCWGITTWGKYWILEIIPDYV